MQKFKQAFSNINNQARCQLFCAPLEDMTLVYMRICWYNLQIFLRGPISQGAITIILYVPPNNNI